MNKRKHQIIGFLIEMGLLTVIVGAFFIGLGRVQ